MRILMLSQWFDPEPFYKGLPFARKLLTRGHEVQVLTGFPNGPEGKVYPGYKIRPWQREQIAGISVVRVPLYPDYSKSVALRAINYASFAASAATIGCALINRPDVVYVYHPPPTVGLPAIVTQALYGVPFVYDIQDLWPDTVRAVGIVTNKCVLSIVRHWCNYVYKRADRLVVLSPGFKRALEDRGVAREKIEVIYNWCDYEDDVRPVAPREYSQPEQERRFRIVFAGTMGVAQALHAVLEAAHICRETVPRAQFVFVGRGLERARLERMAVEMGLDNVEFLAYRPRDAMGLLLASADVLLVHLKDDPLFRITIPSKTQAYLAAGRPILMGVRGDAADLVARAGAGLTCKPENPASIAAAVRTLAESGPERLNEMGRAGQAFYERELSLSNGVNKFETLFKSAVDNGRRRKLAPSRC
jgi:colanic acid biosynthesis glycosyl transferase WcaI